MSGKAHTDAVLAMLTGVSGLTVHDGHVPANPVLPYVVLFTDDGLDQSTVLSGAPDLRTVLVQVTGSGVTRTSVQVATAKAHAALVGRIPTVTGRKCGVIRQVASRPITEDRDVTPHLLYVVNQYEFVSVAS